MSQSLSATYLHLIFSTKNRQRWFTDAALRTELHSYLGGISKNLDCPPIIVGGVDDHVHILARMGRCITQSDWVKEIKRVSHTRLKAKDAKMRDFSWQAGYGIFSVSASSVEVVTEYIRKQEEHHKKTTFQEEYRTFLKSTASNGTKNMSGTESNRIMGHNPVGVGRIYMIRNPG
jgi:REP element-mobilizing transposase RayT